MFSARGIAVVVGAEHHASLFGPVGSSFLSLDIWVDEEDSEEAAALLRDAREHDESIEDEEGDSGGDDGSSRAPEDAGEDAGDDAAPGSSLRLDIDRRRRTGVVVLLGCCITFGTAHMFTRAWKRGLTLAAVEVAGIMQLGHLGHGNASGGVIAAAILTDLIGALWRVWAAPASTLPRARVHGR